MDHIFSELITLVNFAEGQKDKKTWVMNSMRVLLGNSYHRYAPLLDITIDGLVALSRKTIQLNLNKKQLFPCI
jgi:hypothetical protein